MIVALCELGIELDDPRFVKNGNTMLDNLMTFYRQGEGFLHTQSAPGPTRWRRSRASTAWWRPAGGGGAQQPLPHVRRLSIPDAWRQR